MAKKKKFMKQHGFFSMKNLVIGSMAAAGAFVGAVITAPFGLYFGAALGGMMGAHYANYIMGKK